MYRDFMKTLCTLLLLLFATTFAEASSPSWAAFSTNSFMVSQTNPAGTGSIVVINAGAIVPGYVTNAASANTFIGLTGMYDQDDKNDIYGFYNEMYADGLNSSVFEAEAFGNRFSASGTTNIIPLYGLPFSITGPVNQNLDGIQMWGSTTGVVSLPFGMKNYTVWATYRYNPTNGIQNALAAGFCPLWILKNTTSGSLDAMILGDYSVNFTYQENNGGSFVSSPIEWVSVKTFSQTAMTGFYVNVCYTRSNGVSYAWHNCHPDYWNGVSISTNSTITDSVNQLGFGFDPILNSSSAVKLGSLELDAIMMSSNAASSQSFVNDGYRALSWLHKGHSCVEFTGDSRMAMGQNPVGPLGTTSLTDWVWDHYAYNQNEKYINYSQGGALIASMTNNLATGTPWGWSELTNLPTSKYTYLEVDTDMGFNDFYLSGLTYQSIIANLTNVYTIPKLHGAKIGQIGIWDVGTNNNSSGYVYNNTYSNGIVKVNEFALTNAFFDIVYPFNSYITQFELNTNNGLTTDSVHFGFDLNPDQTIPVRFAGYYYTKGKPWASIFNGQATTASLYPAYNNLIASSENLQIQTNASGPHGVQLLITNGIVVGTANY